jgi:L-glutamine:2-deoxy-scyllo-inosose/3-amino-2,3-dideoxy-scyllo-inosose aminotransferase
VDKFRKALEKELGAEIEPSYEPLNNCSLYVPLTKPSRHKLSDEYWEAINPARFSLPVCEKVYNEQSVCMHHSVLMGGKKDMDIIAEAIKKIYDNADELK